MSNLTTRLLLVVVGTVFYLGLAVLGRGGVAGFFSQPALIALTVVLVVLSAVALLAGGNLSPGCARTAATVGSSGFSRSSSCSTVSYRLGVIATGSGQSTETQSVGSA